MKMLQKNLWNPESLTLACQYRRQYEWGFSVFDYGN